MIYPLRRLQAWIAQYYIRVLTLCARNGKNVTCDHRMSRARTLEVYYHDVNWRIQYEAARINTKTQFRGEVTLAQYGERRSGCICAVVFIIANEYAVTINITQQVFHDGHRVLNKAGQGKSNR